jgi:hypothetical protein
MFNLYKIPCISDSGPTRFHVNAIIVYIFFLYVWEREVDVENG